MSFFKNVGKIAMLVAGFIIFAGQASAITQGELIIVAADGQFLGSFENEYSTKSVYNRYGNFGSQYSSTSIFNKYSDYGSDYSDTSPFNKYASNAPWLMDKRGNRYGRLSINRYAQGVTDYSYKLALRLKALRDSR
ncbi:MAG: hypothetical protein J1D88_01680 [Treponema sp.]|nr:hypothetical protein [Treponema sp.]